MDREQAILGFTEFFKDITGNQNLEIPSEIAEKIGLQAQADGDIITALCSLPKIISEDGQDYVQLFDVLKTVKRYTAKADDGMREATPEERESVDKYIKSISKPTGVNFGDLADGEYINRQQVMSDYADWYGYDYQNNWFYKHLKNMSSVAIPPAEPKTEQFAKWLASEIFDEWEYNKDSFAEIACRKLAKLGIVRAKGDEWELVEPQESEG